jgi:hypothetical protein
MEPCQKIHGRALFYSADSQFRIWNIGTHHEFAPDYDGADQGASWDRIMNRLKNGDKVAGAANRNALFADFVVCPVEPFRKGYVQRAVVRGMSRVRVVRRDKDGETQKPGEER